ncbi:MAG: M20/M25/M40 family metallo-hydrolase [Gammaproteobacteria bacterium]|nr:M20/M25/M40 family metallo-hydrolase [Gammaproteobacteria bacterium]
MAGLIVSRLWPALALLGFLFTSAGVGAGPAAEHLAAAVRFPTVSHQHPGKLDSEAFNRLHRFFRSTYPETFARLKVEVVNGYSLLLEWPGQDSALAPVLFTAHMDVVPVEPGTAGDWSHPPFAGVIENGVIYGRGTLDDKLGVISLLEAVERLLQQGFAPQRSLFFGFGHDEEIGGVQGAGAIAQRFRERGLYFSWMLDEGGYIISDNPLLPERQVALVGVAEKLYLTLLLKTRGAGGHSSRPPPTTTIGRLAAAVVRVENNPFPAKIVPPIDTMLTRSAQHMEFPMSFLFGNLWLTEPLVARILGDDQVSSSFVRTTTAATMFNAGVKENVIPQAAEARINFRLLPGDTPEMVLAHVTRVVDDPEVEISALPREGARAPVAAMEGGGFEVISRATRSVYRDVVMLPYMMPATTDVRHYVDLADNHYRFHGALISMGQAEQVHGTNEQLAVESFEQTVAVAVAILEAAGQP